jgi:DNA-binding PadR family transcriptional regulator
MAPTSTRLLVLGVVRDAGPVHGYVVRRTMLARGWANAPGSIYNSLKTLEREGLVETTGAERDGARPERTLFALTDAGEAEFQRLLRDTLWHSAQPNHPLLSGLAMLPLLPRTELIEIMRHRAAGLRQQAADACQMRTDILAGSPIPPHVAESYRLIATQLRSEAEWAEQLADRLSTRTGEQLTDADWM